MIPTLSSALEHSIEDIAAALAHDADDAEKRRWLGRILPALDALTATSLSAPGAGALARVHWSETYLVALGPSAAHKSLQGALEQGAAGEDSGGREKILTAATHGATALGALGEDLLATIEEQAGSLPNSARRARLFAALAGAHGARKNSAKSAKLTTRALNGAEKLTQREDRALAMAAVSDELRTGGLRDEAASALDRALEIARKIEDEPLRNGVLLVLSAAFSRAGRGGESLSFLVAALQTGSEENTPAIAPAATQEKQQPAPEDALRQMAQAALDNDPSGHNGEQTELHDPTAGVRFPSFTSSRKRRG